jgi:hypothetical protein
MASQHRARRGLSPRKPEQSEVVRSVRLPEPVFRRITEQLGERSFSEWVRTTLDEVSCKCEERAVQLVRQEMRIRGVTLEMLIKTEAAEKP